MDEPKLPRVKRWSISAWKNFEIMDEERVIASTTGMESEDKENAYLMAAAPELLEALKIVQQMLTNGELVRDISLDAKSHFATTMLDFVPKLNKIVMAIAKAEGRE